MGRNNAFKLDPLPGECVIPAPPWPLPPTKGATPDYAGCARLWDEKGLQPHIRTHCIMVAQIAMGIGRQMKDAGVDINLAELLAAALLHDLAKSWTLRHGGSHAQIGACWVQQETKNPRIAQAVLFHVHWPWEMDARKWAAPLIVQYADKRVKHDEFVTVEERFIDLKRRYGVSERALMYIGRSHEEAKLLEHIFTTDFGVSLHENCLDSGWMVD